MVPTADATSLSNDKDCKSILSAMLKQEVHYLSAHHLQITKKSNKDGTQGSSSEVDVSCREQVCKWIFRIINNAGMERETAIIAMNFLDRFMSTSGPAAQRLHDAIDDSINSYHLHVSTLPSKSPSPVY